MSAAMETSLNEAVASAAKSPIGFMSSRFPSELTYMLTSVRLAISTAWLVILGMAGDYHRRNADRRHGYWFLGM